MSAGTLTVGAASYVGDDGKGTLNITGGHMTLNDRLYVGERTVSSYSGNGTVSVSGSSSILDINADLRVGAGGTGTMTMSNGAQVNVSGNTGVGSWILVFGANSVPADGAPVRDVQYNGTGTLNLNGTAGNRAVLTTDYIWTDDVANGKLNLNGGILRAGANGVDLLQDFAPGNVTIGSGGGGAFIDTNGFSVSISSPLSGAGALYKLGSGTLTLNNTNTYSGDTVVDFGSLSVTGTINSALDVVVGQDFGNLTTLTIASGAVVNARYGVIGINGNTNGSATVSGTWTSSANMEVGRGGTGTLNIQSGGKVNADNVFIGTNSGATGTVTISGAGSELNAAVDLRIGNTGNGTLYLTGGTVNVVNGTGTVSLARDAGSSGVLNIGNGSTAGALNAAAVNGGSGIATVNFNHTGNVTFAPQLTGSLWLNKLGTGNTTLTTANSYTGRTTIFEGTLTLSGGDDRLPTTTFLRLNPLTIGGSALLSLNNVNQTVGSISFGGNGGMATNSTASIATGTGTLTLGGDVAYDPSNGPGGATISGKVDLGAADRTFDVGDSSNTTSELTVSASISGTGKGLTKTNSGTLILSGVNSYTGATTINAGTLVVSGGDQRLPTSTTLIINPTTPGDTAKFSLNNVNQSVGSLAFGGTGAGANSVASIGTGTGTLTLGGNVTYDSTNGPGGAIITGNIDLGAADRTFDIGDSSNATADLTIGANISGSGRGLTKTNAGTLVLSGINSYSGSTVVGAGTLQVDGSISNSAVTVTGGTLRGVGTVGALAVNSSSTLAPGDSPGILHVNGNLKLNIGSIFSVELNGATVGTGFDQVDVAGMVDLTGAILSLSAGFLPADGTQFMVIKNDLSDAITGEFANIPQGTSFAQGGRYYTMNYFGGDGNDVVVSAGVVTVPEMSSVWTALAACGFCALNFKRRRRSRC